MQENSVTVEGNHVFAADGDAGLQVFDIRDPANPVLVGRHDLDGHHVDLAIHESLAYVEGATGLTVIDISNPANIFQLATTKISISKSLVSNKLESPCAGDKSPVSSKG